MRWGAIFALLMAVATGRMATAQQRGAESGEEVQRACEGAMDDVLHGEFKGLETLFKEDTPEARIVAFADWYDRQYTLLQPEWGEPVDWKFLAATKMGSGLRQYIYVCRFAGGPVFWYFTATEEGGRWFLLDSRFDSVTDQLLARLPLARPCQQDYLPLCRSIMAMLAHGKREVGETIRNNLSYRGPLADLKVDQITERGAAMSREGGRVLRCEPIGTKDLGGILAECYYAVQFERGWQFCRFLLYRPGEKWKLMGMYGGENPETVFARFPVMADGEASPVLTARSAGKDTTEEAETALR